MIAGIARATREKRRIGRLHANRGGPVTAKRNRQRLWTACGLRLDMAFPFEVDERDPVSLCLRCFPQANPNR